MLHKSYRFLTDEGIEYLREYLNLPSDIVPATLKKSTRPLERVPDRPPRGDRFGGGDRPRRDYGVHRCTLPALLPPLEWGVWLE